MDLTNRKKKKTEVAKTVDITMYGKVPPQARELEEAVIAAILVEKDAFYKLVDVLKSEMFYVDAHQRIYQACARLASKYQPIDTLTVVEELKSSEELDIVGGPYAIVKLTNGVTSSANIVAHAGIIVKKFLKREMIRIAGHMLTEAYEDHTEVNSLLDVSTTMLYDITKGMYKKDFINPLDNAMEALKEIDNKMAREEGTITGEPSGFKDLDACTSGWQPTDLIVLAARPSVGKTALSLNFAYNLATHQQKKKPVAFFSLEMSARQLVQRIISSMSGIPLKKIRNGDLNQVEYAAIKQAITKFSETPIFIDDTPAINTIQVRAKLRRLISHHGVGLVIIDYIQLMQSVEYQGNKSRSEQLGDISRDLKIMAKDFEIPIIALSQLSRAVETRTDAVKVPNLSDLRDSGAIEQDADMVIFLYMDGEVPRLRVAKHRNGELTYITLQRDMSIQQFLSKENEGYKPPATLVANSKAQFDDGYNVDEDFSFKNKQFKN